MPFLHPPVGSPAPLEPRLRVASAPRVLAPESWPTYFGSIDREREGLRASVEVMPAEARGAHTAQRPLREIRYDADRRVLELAVGARVPGELAVRYFLCDLRSIKVAESKELTEIFTEDARGALTLVQLFPGWGSTHRGSVLDPT